MTVSWMSMSLTDKKERCSAPSIMRTPVHIAMQSLPRQQNWVCALPCCCQADLLKQWMPSFKDHSTLSSNQQHKSLYSFLGRVAVLR